MTRLEELRISLELVDGMISRFIDRSMISEHDIRARKLDQVRVLLDASSALRHEIDKLREKE